jgi:hypothetical protein
MSSPDTRRQMLCAQPGQATARTTNTRKISSGGKRAQRYAAMSLTFCVQTIVHCQLISTQHRSTSHHTLAVCVGGLRLVEVGGS